MEFFRHKRTNQNLLLKKRGDSIFTLFVLDQRLMKIEETNYRGVKLKNVSGGQRYKVAVCDKKNLIKLSL